MFPTRDAGPETMPSVRRADATGLLLSVQCQNICAKFLIPELSLKDFSERIASPIKLSGKVQGVRIFVAICAAAFFAP